ncbi:unnamed protein product [Sphenostylis stenocarpa]|uniref:Uncharacterized protein n=1 Tax=Sphenostylis stenocarpa TaxID=92480 RepID=A0AA86S7S3_9FABA|nr:unnamed protein product [Sphenostylis stenocarpa]
MVPKLDGDVEDGGTGLPSFGVYSHGRFFGFLLFMDPTISNVQSHSNVPGSKEMIRPDRVSGIILETDLLCQCNPHSWNRKLSLRSYLRLKIQLYWANLLWQKFLNLLWLDSK